MKKTLLNVLNVCVIFLAVSCASCKKFEWDPKPYSGDSKHSQLVYYTGETVKCNQPLFDEMTCFDADNIAELKTAIDKVNMSKKQRKKVNNILNKINPLK